MRERRARTGRSGIGGWLALAGGLMHVVVAPPAAAQSVEPALPTLEARPRAKAARALRNAQAAYELARHRALPDYPGGAPTSPCEVPIGRFCYWDNNDEPPPPAERPAAVRARASLLARLDSAAAADPADDWAVGQRVRYLLEARRRDDAVAAAAACRGTPWWCQALASLALHARGDHARGDFAAALAAHDSARALLPGAAERCAWDDVTPWLPGGAARAYRRLGCGSAERVRYERRFWRLAQPFWAMAGNDLRTELAARRTLARLHGAGANPYGIPWGDDAAEIDVRYGVPTAWSVRRPAAFGSAAGPMVVGHEPAPSYDFTPDERTLRPAALLGTAGPGSAVPGVGAWSLRRRPAQTRYAPAYAAGGVRALDYQLARFRRGDTLLVVGAYEIPADTARPASEGMRPGVPPDSGPVTAALVLDDGWGAPAVARRRDDAPRRGALVAALVDVPVDSSVAGRGSTPAWLASLEVLELASASPQAAAHGDAAAEPAPGDSAPRGRAARVRAPVAVLPAGALVSDVLLVRPGDYGPAPALAAVVDSAAGAPVVRAGALFGLYWEQYGAGAPRRPVAAGAPPAVTPTATPTVAITATRLGARTWERLGALVGRPLVLQPVSLRYADPVPAGAPPGRYVALRWPEVPPGTYRLEVTVTPAGGTPAGPPTGIAAEGASPDSAPSDSTPPDSTLADSTSPASASPGSAPPASAPPPRAVTSLVVRVVR